VADLPAPARLDRTTAAALDTSIPDANLSQAQLSRRRLLRSAGVIGRVAGGAAVPFEPVVVSGPGRNRPLRDSAVRHWLAGDHHVHTVFSPDGVHTVLDQARHAHDNGLGWMVVTDHGGPTHVRIGAELTAPEVRTARRALPELLVFQGLEWQIPAAEHGTVIVTPGPGDVDLLTEFERDFDANVTGSTAWTRANEALAVAGVRWLGAQVDAGRIHDALFLANHPSRQGLDTPHELRNWRDADPRVAIGFEGAPGHQAAGITAPDGPGESRGYYGRDRGTDPNQYQAYPQESYRTWGGFDWMTATVGGLWDSLLAEGKPWSITANSDSHDIYLHPARRREALTKADFDRDGRYPPPEYRAGLNTKAGDYWPGHYSRTHVGSGTRSYRGVARGLRDGRVWVDHGHLVAHLDVRVRRAGAPPGRGVTIGGTLAPPRGSRVEVTVRATLQDRANGAGFVPSLNRVDLIRGAVRGGPAAERDRFTAPDTRVIRSWDTSGSRGTLTLVHAVDDVDEPFYVRLRGTDGNIGQPGLLGPSIDPSGPRMDPAGAADPGWTLWLYSNPIWVVPS